MKYAQIIELKEEEFRRLTGVKKETFAAMVEILEVAEREKKKRGGCPNKVSLPDRLLMTLEYLREYRTYFHIASSYGISESSCYRNIVWVENTLIKHPKFHLPGKKALQDGNGKYDVITIDATESPIQRPKKNSENTTQGRKRDIQ
jgi:hypothetical protein